MADSYSVQAVLSVKDKNFTSTLKNAERSLSNVGSAAENSSSNVGLLGSAFAIANTVISSACSAIKNSVSKAVERVDTLNQFPAIMENMGFSADDAQASIDKLSEGIQGLPTALDDIVESTENIALITGNLDEATDVALALNDALIASGASTDEAASATEAYSKMLATGKVNSQNWTTLERDMKYALQQVAEELGITSGNTQELYTAMQNGEITFDDFNDALVTCSEGTGGFAEMAHTSSQGIATSWQNVQTAVVRGVANMIQAWNDAAEDNGLPTIQESLGVFQTVVDKVFGACSKAITVFVDNLDVIVAAVGPVVAAIAGFEIVKKASEWFGDFKDKGKEAADALNNYKDTADIAKDRTGDLQKAEDNLKSATDNLKDAQDKVNTAMDKVTETSKKAKDAHEKVDEAQQKVDSSAGDAADAVEELKEATKKAQDADKDYKDATDELKSAMDDRNDAMEIAQEATEEFNTAQDAQSTAIEGATIKAIAHNAIMAVLSGNMKVGEAAVKAFNAAWDANPIGLVTTAITAAVSVVSTIITVLKKFGVASESAWKKSKEFKEEVDDLTESVEENRKSMEDNTKAAKNQSNTVNDLCTKITELAGKENKTADDTSLLRTYIDQLNDSVDDLNLAYDETTDSLNMATEAMLAQAEVENKSNEYATAQENYNQALEDYLALSDELAAAEELEAETSDLAIGAKTKQSNAVKELEEAQTEQAEVLEQCLADMQAAEAEYTEAQNAACALQEQALAESVANQTLTLDQLSEANQETVQQLNETWQDYTDAATNMFDTLDTEVETTVQDMIDNMQKNQEIMSQWGDNCEALRDRFENLGLDPAILDQLVDLGPEGAGYIQELVDASDEELQELSETYSEGGEVAYQAMCQSLGEGATEVIEEAKNLVIQTEDSFREQVEATDWTSLGESMDEGVAEGVESGSDQVSEAASTAVEDARDAAGEAAGEGSPATEWIPLGESMDEGVAEGLTTSTAGVEAAKQMADTIINAADEALSAADFSGAVDSMCSTIASATENGMQQVSKAVTSAMDNATKALTDGYSQMASATTSSMSTVNSAVTSGMNTVKSTFSTTMNAIKSNVQTTLSNISSNVTSQMNTIKSTITTVLSNIKSTVTSTMSSIKSTVTSDMNSIKSTVTSTMNSIKSETTSGMNSLKSTFSSGMNSCVSTARSCSSSIVSAFSGLYSSLYSSGTSAMSGLQAGLNAGSGAVMSTARSIANSVTSTINSALKVGSPSKVLEDTGEYAGEGLVIGLKNMLSKVRDVALEMADTVTDLAFGTFDAPNLAFEGGMTMSYYFDDAVVDALDDLTDALLDEDKEYTFTIPVEIDGREVAKATATFTQDELNKLEARSSRRDKFSISQ